MTDGYRLLLAEDTAVTRKIVGRQLSDAGYHVTAVENGRLAFDLFRKTPFPIVITDWMMPEMDGLELCRAIRSLDISGYVFIVLLTARNKKEDIVAGLDAGADDYLCKPFNPAELAARLNTGRRILDLEKSLTESKRYIEGILASMADSLTVVRPDMSIVHTNRQACDLLGYTQEEMTILSLDQVFDGKIDIRETLQEAVRQNQGVQFPEVFYWAKTGERIPVSFNASLMSKESIGETGSTEIICVARDMREINKLQAQVLQTEKMASIGAIAAGVAHEIKNPLAIILQGIEFIDKISKIDAPGELLDDSIARIKKATVRADRIVKDLLGFTRQIMVEFEPLAPISVIEETVALVENQLRLKNIMIKREYAADVPKIRANSGHLQQVFLNILINASESIRENGNITIHVDSFEVVTGQTLVRMSFSDTGQGLPEEIIGKVFDPFFSTKIRKGNSGLGLSVSKGIIEKHNGSIDIENLKGGGARVTITIPCGNRGGTD